MTNEKFLTMSSDGKSEYCCSVVRLGELIPVEGSDFLAKTDVMGTQIVVRKDMMKEGDIMFYAANETALNEKFLSVNNLFEIGCRDMNANAEEVKAIMAEYELKYKNEADKLRAESKNVKGCIEGTKKSVTKLKKKIEKLNAKKENEEDLGVQADIQEEINGILTKIDELSKRVLEQTVSYTNLKSNIEKLVNDGKPIVDKAKELCGFFNKYGRVRCITLKGCPSFGFLFSVESMAAYNKGILDVNLEDYINQDFDTVDGELFVKAYVPPTKPANVRKPRGEKKNKKLSRFDRMIAGEFYFHYDTTPLQKNMHLIKPESMLTISIKLHGTSVVIGKLQVKEKKRIAFYKYLWNKFIDTFGVFKDKRCIDYNIAYGPVYSSRTVIKNQYINEDVNAGYYGTDIWSEYGDIIYPYLEEGMTVYGEIFGYLTGCQTMIQKHYDYGCKEGDNKVMFYRITTTLEDGKKREWNVGEVYDWTMKLIERMKEREDENYKRIHPIDILYHGTLEDLYPDLDTENHWHEHALAKLKADKEHFGMEDYEPLCKYNKVPREGIVLRIEDDPVLEAFKLKTTSFAIGEAVLYDDDNYVDIEVAENNY